MVPKGAGGEAISVPLGERLAWTPRQYKHENSQKLPLGILG